MNVARLAGLPVEVLSLATQQSKSFLSKNDTGSNSSSEEARRNLHAIRQRYFDAIVSFISSSMVDAQLYAITAELWRRCVHEMSQAGDN